MDRRRPSRTALLVALISFPLAVGAVAQWSQRSAVAVETRPNIVMILTDDQRADTLRYMPIVRRALGDHGVTFTDAYVVDPVCCPSRASILTGLYPHSTGVYSNDPDDHNGGFPAFDDRSTIATWLQDAGYRTGLFGKYLNGYDTEYVPPGWDRWFATHEGGAYYDYHATSDGTVETYGRERRDYGTTVLGREAAAFIRGTPEGTPLFAYVSVPAPHAPFVAAPADRKAFGTLKPWRPPNYNEKRISDKPRYLREVRWLDGERRTEIDATRMAQLRTLPAVDRLVGEVIEELKATGRLNDTIVVFTSDNGMLWGEHRWDGKEVPYEESIKVPMLIRYDALGLTARKDRHLVLNVDLAPTFAAAAGVFPSEVEGSSLLPLLTDPGVEWRDGFLIEHMSSIANGVPSYCGWHTGDYVLVRYSGSVSELYDLRDDPWQLESRDEDETAAEIRSTLDEQLIVACRPPPPALLLN